MPMMDRLLERLEDLCRDERTQRRLQQNLLDPAAAYLARKLWKYMLAFAALIVIHACLVLGLVVRR